MSKNNIVIPVVLGEKSFKSYLTFDVMKRQRLWKKPVTRDMEIIWNLIEKKLDPPRLHKAKNISR